MSKIFSFQRYHHSYLQKLVFFTGTFVVIVIDPEWVNVCFGAYWQYSFFSPSRT